MGQGQESNKGRKELAVVTLGEHTSIDIRGVIQTYGWPITVEKATRYIAEGSGAELYPELQSN